MGDENKGLEVKQPKANNVDDLTKVLQSFTEGMRDLKNTQRDKTEEKESIDDMKKQMTKLMETISQAKKESAGAKALDPEASTKDVGFGYDVKEILNRTELKNKSFDELLLVPSENNDSLKSLQSRASDIYILASIISKHRGVTVKSIVPHLRMYQDFLSDTENVRKAMSIGSGDEGFDWIPTGFAADLIEIFHLQMVVANLHPRFTIPQRLGNWTVPGTTSDLKAFRTTQHATDTPTKFRASTRVTRNLTFIPQKLVAATVFDVELEEDSIIPVLPNLKLNIAQALMRAVEDTIINGDTGLTQDNLDMHGNALDSESPAAMWDGYRRFITQNGNTRQDGNGGATLSGMISVMRNMGKYGINPSNLAWVTGPNGYFDAFLQLSKVQTLDLFGSNAIILKGELAKFMGIPIIVSEQERQDLKTTTGVSGGASAGGYTDTSIQLVWKPGFSYGVKRKITVESAKIPRTDAVEVWATLRSDFKAGFQTSEEIVSEITNVV